jgi:hypothetical protein
VCVSHKASTVNQIKGNSFVKVCLYSPGAFFD